MQAREGIKPAQYHITWSDDTDRQLVLWPQIVHFFHLSWLRVAVCPYNPGPAVCLNKQLRHPHCVSPKPDAHREPRRITSQMYCLLCVSLSLSHTHSHKHVYANLTHNIRALVAKLTHRLSRCVSRATDFLLTLQIRHNITHLHTQAHLQTLQRQVVCVQYSSQFSDTAPGDCLRGLS